MYVRDHEIKEVSGKKFLSGIIIAFCFSSVLFSSGSDGNKEKKKAAGKAEHEFNIDSIAEFCAHEHWGSLDPVGGYLIQYSGYYCDVYAGATPQVPVSIWDLVLDPYFTWMLKGAGVNPDEMANAAGYKSQKSWWESDPRAALDAFSTFSGPFLMNGTLQCIFRGIEKLYDVHLLSFDIAEWKKADLSVRSNYNDIFAWYRDAMKKSNFSELIRPVQPEFYLMMESSRKKTDELSFTHTILRIDPFLDFWNVENKRRDNLSKISGVDPIDAESWRKFIGFYVELAEKNHTTGIKSLQAYNRDLDFKFRKDDEVKFRGDLNEEEIKIFQDWVMNEFCRLANERKWVHQIHVGTNNLKFSNPLPLEDLGTRFPEMKIVMLHCWPFFNESAYLAKYFPNFYIDLCWAPVLSPRFFREALDIYLNFVPYSKIMLSNDATSIEMATGSSLFIREILKERLLDQKAFLKLTEEQLLKAAIDMLNNNAVNIYGIGDKIK